MSDDTNGGNQATTFVNALLDNAFNSAFEQNKRRIERGGKDGLVGQRLDELDAEVTRLEEASTRLTLQNAVVVALLVALRAELTRDSALVDAAGLDLQESGVTSALRASQALALRGVDSQTLARLGIRWNTPDPEALTTLVGYTQSSAWRDSINAYGERVAGTVENQVLRGLVEGWSPRKTAREMRRIVETLPASYAEMQARTLQLESYRTATAISHRLNADIATKQIRIGTLDNRICLACLSLHGEEMTIGDKVNDHHNGRCTSVLVVRGYPEPNIITGERWFNNQPEARQREIVKSDTIYNALTSNQARLSDFVHTYNDDVYGQMVRQGTIEAALNKRK